MTSNLDFSSDSPAIEVNSDGVMTLRDNSYRTVGVTSDAGTASVTTQLRPNLSPDNWDVDVDMTNTNGLQFGPKSNGESFSVDIRVNANAGALVTFSLKLWYDPDVLTVTGCEKSGAWADKSYESNTASTLGEILLVGIGGNADGKISSSGMITVTQCTFQVSSSQAVTSRISGYVSEF